MNAEVSLKGKKQPLKTSLIVSMYNIAEGVKPLYRMIVETAEEFKGSLEIIFVDDGSTDETYEALVSIARRDSRVRVIKMRSNFGEAAALEVGLQ